MKKYQFIVADCPFEYDNKQQNDPARGGIQYPQMSMQDLYNLPVRDITDENCMLAFWVMMPKLVDQYYEKYDPISIIRAWGFRPVTVGFVWVKTNRRGALIEDNTVLLDYDDYYSGMGRYTNSNVECVIIGRKGKALERVNKNVKQLIFAPIGNHSEKPQEQYERYNKLWSIEDKNIPAIELFARKQNPPPKHYDGVGLDWQPSTDIRDFLKGYR